MYSLANLFKWKDRPFDLSDESCWLDLLDDFGPALPRFLLDDSCAQSIPDDDGALDELRQSLNKPMSSLKPEIGSAWVLFAFKDDLAALPLPFRQDGILLPFEWRIGEEGHGKLLPGGLVRLAELVKRQFGPEAENCTLHPSRHFLDAVDFNIPGATFDSAWGALATGLHLLLSRKKHLAAWPFSTIAYDFESDTPAAVGELERKFMLAACAGAEEIAVAHVQYREAKDVLSKLQAKHPKNKSLKKLRIYHWKPSGGFRRSLASLAKCNQYSRRNRMLSLIALVFCACTLGVGIFATLYVYDWNRETIEYYADYVDRNGVAEGRFPMKGDSMATRGRAYRFHYQGYDSLIPCLRRRILRAMWCVNGRGAIRVDENDYPEHPSVSGYRYYYDERGRVSKVERCVAGGRVLNLIRYSGENSEIADVIGIAGGRTTSGKMWFASSKGGEPVRRIEYTRNGDGYVSEKFFQRDSSGVAASDDSGISRIEFDRLKDGRIECMRYFDWRGVAVTNVHGVHFERFIYDKYRLMRIQYCGLDAKPVYNMNKEDERIYEYSQCGNLIQVEKKRYGRLLQRVSYEHDAVGDITRETYFWADGVRHGAHWASRDICLDDMGNVIHETFFDSEGRKLRRNDGFVATVSRCFSATGDLIEEALYDECGRLMIGLDGWAMKKVRFEHRSDGYVAWRRYFGEDGRPILLAKGGMAVEKKTFDLMGREVEWELFGVGGEKIDGALGWQRAVIEYDRYGNKAVVRCYEKSGKMIK